jgi:rsbT co-antagonist protein RsbR
VAAGADTSRGLQDALQAEELVDEWVAAQLAAETLRPDLLAEDDLRRTSAEFVQLLREAMAAGGLADPGGAAWQQVRSWLAALSRTRAEQGFTPTETATFVLSLKEPVFARLAARRRVEKTAAMRDVWEASSLLDRLALATMEEYLEARESVIMRQQEEVLELSTPVVKLWEGVLALPLIGTLDSARTQTVMENLLQALVDTGSETAIIDITGVATVDTLVAQHLIKTVTAARLMGATCIISGIRPQIAQTIVHLGISLPDVVTKATLADAIGFALARGGWRVERGGGVPGA